MSPQLDAIWQQIQRLDEAERVALGLRLHELAESQASEKPGISELQSTAGWRTLYGAADPHEVAELQQIIDQEFSAIDSEDWD